MAPRAPMHPRVLARPPDTAAVLACRRGVVALELGQLQEAKQVLAQYIELQAGGRRRSPGGNAQQQLLASRSSMGGAVVHAATARPRVAKVAAASRGPGS